MASHRVETRVEDLPGASFRGGLGAYDDMDRAVVVKIQVLSVVEACPVDPEEQIARTATVCLTKSRLNEKYQ